MKVYREISDFKNVKNPIVTTGMFDGVHLGHQKIIARLMELARQKSGETVLFTFAPHPRIVLFPDDNGLEMINTEYEKIQLLEKYGIDHLIIYPFTREFSRLTSTEFVRDILVNKIKTKRLVIGYNHHFGRNREGTFEQLKEYSPIYGFEVEEVAAKGVNAIDISSTKIRAALKSGNIKLANNYLGHTYSLTGKVEKGLQLGRTLGYPTANLVIADTYKLVPSDGIYTVQVHYQNKLYGGMLSIGYNPTIEGKGRSIEVHIFNFDKTIYGDNLTVSFIDKLRDEMKFDNMEELKKQMKLDEEHSLKILENLSLTI
jgi:riboflavin kinase/FMN adenylyltransferase